MFHESFDETNSLRKAGGTIAKKYEAPLSTRIRGLDAKFRIKKKNFIYIY